MSRFLRDVEYEHIEYFRDLLASLSLHAGEKTPPLDPDTESYLGYLAETGVFPAHGAADRALDGIKDVCDMLRLGIQAEKDSILYYRDLIEQIPFHDAAAAIRKILSEEKQHFLMLSGLLKRLQSTHSCDTGLTDRSAGRARERRWPGIAATSLIRTEPLGPCAAGRSVHRGNGTSS